MQIDNNIGANSNSCNWRPASNNVTILLFREKGNKCVSHLGKTQADVTIHTPHREMREITPTFKTVAKKNIKNPDLLDKGLITQLL